MHSFDITKHLYTLLFSLIHIANYSATLLTDSSAVSLLTVSPGKPLYSAFGHTGIRVKDPSNGIDVVFNFGTFDDTQKGFYVNFVRGKMLYGVTCELFTDFIWQYENYEKRRVKEQVLELTLSDKQKIFDALAENIKPETAIYYDFSGTIAHTAARCY
jgi:hypothetical protein